ncbi:DUF418 domain-containing protein [Paramicrobacterium chengjingii]|uniref:DUF418 domain-containing protein n=1 Tax=Paramicrobacterium chengjingii TaxID=2769067 RepID=UPI0014219537|nr:DUF418 domain-containing protein [Microbacterium chengjingii]
MTSNDATASGTQMNAHHRAGIVRLVIPDVLRGVAIVAMLVAHANVFLPHTPGAVGFLAGNINDLASPLFALVMGMSAQIVANRSRTPGITYLQQVIRGLVLIVLGVWMATWGSWVAIILAHLGVLLIVGAAIVLLRTKTVIAIALAVAIISSPLNAWAKQQVWAYTNGDAVREIASWIAISPHYRLTNLLPFFLLGALVLRHGMKRDSVLWSMLAIAPIAYLVRPVSEKFLGLPESVSGDYRDTLHDVGLVFLAYAIVVLLVTLKVGAWKRFVDAVFVPLRGCGQVALSLYLLHVALIAAFNVQYGRPPDNNYVGWVIIVPVMIAIGWAWWRYVGTGPVEWLLGFVTGRRKPLLWPREARPTSVN